jgi:putative membrane protein
VRSGLTVIALGFVVARFGLFLALLSATGASHAAAHGAHWPSNGIGIALVLLGVLVILGALHNHRSYVRVLPPDDIPGLAIPWLTSFMAISIAAAGLVLAAYLAIA